MATSQLKQVIHTLHRAAAPHEGAGATDGQLLESYIDSREETAFAALVHRHGPMVWGVCRRLLRCHQDAEDAFQATFLVLVRKAGSVVPKEKVANWLYGVAHQTALYARAAAARRSAREKQVTAMPEPAVPQECSDDLPSLLDQELSRLPEKYRAVIVVCDLQGKTRKEAARQFHLPEGTVASRLATARAMLARRLRRNAGQMSGGALAAVLSPNVSSASVPASVASSTIKAASLFAVEQATAAGAISLQAVALAEGVIKTMLLTKLKIVTAVLVVLAVLGAGAFALTQQVQADRSAEKPVAEKPVPAERRPDQLVRAEKGPAVQPLKEQAEKNTHAQEPQLAACEWAGVERVDVERNTLTFDDKAPAAVAGKTFQVAGDAKTAIDGKPGKLADLPPRALLHGFGLSADRQSILQFDAQGPQLGCLEPARVETVDLVRNTLTFDDKAPAVVASKTFLVAPNANIVIDGKQGKLADLPPGAFLSLGLSADRKSILHFSAQGPNVHDCSGSQVKAVDVERNTVTFDDKARVEVAGKTFGVAPDAHISIDGKPGKLTGLPAGAFVNLTLSVDQKTIRSLDAQGPQVNDCAGSQVKAVDVEKGTITFDDKARAEVAGKTFRVAPDAFIVIDGKPSKLAGLPGGAFVNLTFAVDRETIRHVNAQGPQISDCSGSMVKAVDAEKGTITFDDKARVELAGKTFAVAPDACIMIDGKPGKLAGLPAGAFVNLNLSVDRQTIRYLSAAGQTLLCDCGGSTVKAVDTEKGTITFADKVRAEVAGKTYPVASDASILIDGKPGKLTDLPVGAAVGAVLCVDQKTVGTIYAKVQ